MHRFADECCAPARTGSTTLHSGFQLLIVEIRTLFGSEWLRLKCWVDRRTGRWRLRSRSVGSLVGSAACECEQHGGAQGRQKRSRLHGSSVRKALDFPRTGAAGRPAFGGLTSCTASTRRTSHQWNCAVRSDRHAVGRKPAQTPRHMIVGRANRCPSTDRRIPQSDGNENHATAAVRADRLEVPCEFASWLRGSTGWESQLVNCLAPINIMLSIDAFALAAYMTLTT